MEKKRTRLREKIRYKYRISIINEETFDEIRWIRLSVFNVLIFLFIIVVLVGGASTLSFFYTPLKEYIPGYPDAAVQEEIIRNTMLTDSLQEQLEMHNQYISGIKTILGGDLPPSFYDDMDSTDNSTSRLLERISFDPSREDSMFREQIEEEEKYNLQILSELETIRKDEELLLFAPIKGVIVQGFKPDEGHFGIDLVAAEKEKVVAVDEGMIVFAEWTVETGHVIQIQHKNNLLSVYKHNASLLKKAGDRVKKGEVIAIVGNSGELTTGPHLHLELWREGEAIDPEKHIIF